MNKQQIKQLIKECIEEISLSPDLEFHDLKRGMLFVEPFNNVYSGFIIVLNVEKNSPTKRFNYNDRIYDVILLRGSGKETSHFEETKRWGSQLVKREKYTNTILKEEDIQQIIRNKKISMDILDKY